MILTKIKLWIEDEKDNVLEELGECICDSTSRAVQMYEHKVDKWLEKGYDASLCWRIINDENND
jgi:hypothetical protein